MRALQGRRALLIVGGGIAAYKAPLVVRALRAEGVEVRCVLTRAATEFVTPLALQAVAGSRVGADLFDPTFEEQIGHIELARWPDVILVAPATANLMARVAAGAADDLATTVLLATRAPVVLAPAMNAQMLAHPATQRNLETLRGFGHTLIPPDEGTLACQEVGAGRQPDPPVLIDALARRLLPCPLAGARVVVTAGPTREHIDPVRFMSNPSSGKMGLAMAQAASWLGARVTLVAGPGVAALPAGALSERVEITSAAELADAVLSRLDALDWLVKTAAVGDWRPRQRLDAKRKKRAGDDDETWRLELVRTTDVLREAARRRGDRARPRIIGFAAETHDLERHARLKLEHKGCDAVLGNWVRSAQGDAFGGDESALLALTRGGWRAELGPAPKLDLALEVWQRLPEHLDAPDGAAQETPR